MLCYIIIWYIIVMNIHHNIWNALFLFKSLYVISFLLGTNNKFLSEYLKCSGDFTGTFFSVKFNFLFYYSLIFPDKVFTFYKVFNLSRFCDFSIYLWVSAFQFLPPALLKNLACWVFIRIAFYSEIKLLKTLFLIVGFLIYNMIYFFIFKISLISFTNFL